MSPKIIGILIKTAFGLFVAVFATVFWYYTMGRKPKLALSAKFAEKSGQPVAHLIGGGDVLLLLGTKATLYDMASGASKWTADFHATPAAAPVAATTRAAATPATAVRTPVASSPATHAAKAHAPAAHATPAAPAAPAAPAEKADQLVAKRVERRFAKLQTWAAALTQKRATLKTPLQIEAFNVEAAKYHAELTDARAEAATLHKTEPGAVAHGPVMAAIAETVETPALEEAAETFSREREDFGEDWHHKTTVLADGATLWILQGRRATALDHATGQILKDVTLAGNFADAFAGVGCLYVTAATPDGARQISRLTTTDVHVLAATVSAPLGRFSYNAPGQPASPNLQPLRTEFRAAHSELLQADIRLVESKVTERQVIKGDSVSDMEEADKKTTGGWANDAAVISQVLAKDAAREATGGKERIDESTYEVTLVRPFAVGATPSAPARVQGRPEIFSTATLDLVVAGQTLLAFDHASKKLWESKLAQPISFGEGLPEEQAPNASTATTAWPCMEDGERLYLFDQAFLNTFERATGKLLWRLPSIGIRKVQLDGRGTIYILSSNGTVESLHGYGDNTIPLTIKADARTGRIVWKLEKYEDCFVSGGDLYASRETRNGEDAVNQVFDRSKVPETRFKLYKLSTRNGEPQWEWFQTRRPLSIESDGKKVSLLFRDELQVIKSIAL